MLNLSQIVQSKVVCTLGWQENVKVKFTLEQATKTQKGSRDIALLFL
jgi:hypothetical protein